MHCDGDYRAVDQAELAQFFKRKQGSQRVRKLQRAAEIRARLGEAIADRRALRRLEKYLRELDRSHNSRRRIMASPRQKDDEKKRRAPQISITRLSKPLPAYSCPILDRLGRQGIFLHIEYDGARTNRYGVAARRIEYDLNEEHAELVDGEMVFASNMGKTKDEVVAAAHVSETVSRAARSNAKIGFNAIYRLSPDLDQKGRVKALTMLEACFERRGVPYCMVLHAPSPEGDQRNYHIHVWFSHRPMERVGPYEWDVGEQLRSDLDGRDAMRDLRREWAEILTEVSRTQGDRSIFTALSNAARGLPHLPVRKLNKRQVAKARRGEIVADVEANRHIIAANTELWDRLRLRRKAPAKYRPGLEISPAKRMKVEPVHVVRSRRLLVPPPASAPAKAVPSVFPNRPKIVGTATKPELPRVKRIRAPLAYRVTTHDLGRLSANPLINPLRSFSFAPQRRTRRRLIIPAQRMRVTPQKTSVRPKWIFSVAEPLIFHEISPAKPMRRKISIDPKRLHSPLSHLGAPLVLTHNSPRPVTKRAALYIPSSEVRGFPERSASRAIAKEIEPFRDWDDVGAQKWLVAQGFENDRAAIILGRLAVTRSTVAESGDLPRKEGMASRNASSPGLNITAPPRDRRPTAEHHDPYARIPSMLPRLEALMELRGKRQGNGHTASAPTNAESDKTIQKLKKPRQLIQDRNRPSPISEAKFEKSAVQRSRTESALASDNGTLPLIQSPQSSAPDPGTERTQRLQQSMAAMDENAPEWVQTTAAKMEPLFVDNSVFPEWWRCWTRMEHARMIYLSHSLAADANLVQRIDAIDPVVAKILRKAAKKPPLSDGLEREAPTPLPPMPTATEQRSSAEKRVPKPSEGTPKGPHANLTQNTIEPTGHVLVDRWMLAKAKDDDEAAQNLAAAVAANEAARRAAAAIDEHWRHLIEQDFRLFEQRAKKQKTHRQAGDPKRCLDGGPSR